MKTRRETRHAQNPPATRCPKCGGDKARKSNQCHACANENRRWTRDTIIAAAKTWRARYGVAPSANAWNPALLRKHGKQGAVDVFYAGDYPRLSTVQRVFGTWSNMLNAAGLDPAPSGGAGHGKQPTTPAAP